MVAAVEAREGEAVKARPILFSAPMVRALIEGRKSQTRRIVKPLGNHWRHDPPEFDEEGRQTWSGERYIDVDACPYGQPGDLLYVRETWGVITGKYSQRWPAGTTAYRADHGVTHGGQEYDLMRWRPSIHMPRWASRLTLRIKAVRVERLQEISEADALAEGLTKWPHKGDFAYGFDGGWPDGYATHTGAFNALLHKVGRGEAWDRNAWTWVIEFDVIQANVDQVLREAA